MISMLDGFGRKIDYLRISVTDRCNFRCQYCMPEDQKFLKRNLLLNYSEIAIIADRFISHGVRKIRLTGGEPLLRRDIGELINSLGRYVHDKRLEELTLTTNGSKLSEFSDILVTAGVKRINVSLDTLSPEKFTEITRGGRLEDVLAGISSASSLGMRIKINMVALNQINKEDLLPIVDFCARDGHDLSLIETMPLGSGVAGRQSDFIKLEDFLHPLTRDHALLPVAARTAGPARYFDVDGMPLRLGLITPMSKNFCDACNRLRLTTDGKIFMCLGSDMHVDLKDALRTHGLDGVDRLLQHALRLKPERHDFENQMEYTSSRLTRHMNATGG
jgi:GTP 3',8-cyclase